ncbi:MAG: hypothetical protein MJ071_02570 [Oscillospiraceae bacterium]|nr:hypothetical protein [Oscillospiraceae bacterium]
MTFASLPVIVCLFPLFTLLGIWLPKRWKPMTAAIGGLVILYCIGGFSSIILMVLLQCITWLILRLQRMNGDEKKRSLWFFFGAGVQIAWMIPVKMLSDKMSLIPFLICVMQNIESLRQQRNHILRTPSLYSYICYQCDMTRMFAGPVMSFPDYKNSIEQQNTSLAMKGEAASSYIRGLFQLVCLSMPMQSLFQQMTERSMVHTFMDALMQSMAFLFSVCIGVRGAAQMCRGVAMMLGFQRKEVKTQKVYTVSLQGFYRHWLPTVFQWMDRVLSLQQPLDDTAYFSRTVCVLGILGGMLADVSGLLWAVLTALLLTLEHAGKRKGQKPLPAAVASVLTVVAVLLPLPCLMGRTLPEFVAWYGAVWNTNYLQTSSMTGYLLRVNWMTALLCMTAMFPLKQMLEDVLRKNWAHRLLRRLLYMAAETTMLLAAYATLLNYYIRN